MQKIQCEILGISQSAATGGAYVLILKEIDGPRRLPIIIGAYEAQAIALEIEGIKPPRPLTHDLLKQIIDNLGGSVVEIIISDLIENTFYAKIVLEISGITNEIDARPSDAVALSVRTQTPIFVEEKVIESAGFIPEEQEKEIPKKKEAEDEVLPKSKEARIAILQNKLREAIEAEEYERAAKIRDDLKRLSGNN